MAMATTGAVSNCHAATVETMEVKTPTIDDYMKTMMAGSLLWKVKSLNKWYRRKYILDLQNHQLTYEGTHKLPLCTGAEQDISIDITDIHEVRQGWKTDTFNHVGSYINKQALKSPGSESLTKEKCCFSIIHGPNHKTLDLVAGSEDISNAWYLGLTQFIAIRKSMAYRQSVERWLKQQFRNSDKDKSGSLTFDECLDLLTNLNIKISKSHAHRLFTTANFNTQTKRDAASLDEQEFVKFYNLLLKRPELEELMNKFSIKGSNVMTSKDLQVFLQQEQKMFALSPEECDNIIKTFENHKPQTVNGLMTIEGFRQMLLSDQHSIFKQEHTTVFQDMDQPLSHYYIASSHNTYLIGNQLAGESSVEGYIRAFLKGCRSVELDCWDGPDGEPVIYHGHTLTSKIFLKDVLADAIKPYAFVKSDYPVILSVENHCCLEQQRKMAEHFKNILGDLLYTKSIPKDMTALPSPASLKKKILLKGKKLPDIDDEDDDMNGAAASDTEEESVDGNVLSAASRSIAQELSDLIVYFQNMHLESFEACKRSAKFYQMFSLSEKKALRLVDDDGIGFVENNNRQLCRIYPAGNRTNSSNFDPFPFWNVGCQMVTMNYQTKGKELMYYEAKFEPNAGCGYILKPEFMLTGNYDPAKPLDDQYMQLFQIMIISGQFLPKPGLEADGEVIDPYVKVKIRGHPEDKVTVSTTSVHNNGFNPVWNESFRLRVKLPDLAMVSFVVFDHSTSGKDEKLGQFILPFNSLAPGYRHIHLRDASGAPMVPATLFVHVNIIHGSMISTNKQL